MRIHIYTDEDAFIIKMEVYKLQTICCISSDYLFKYRFILLENNTKCMNIRYVHVALAIWEYMWINDIVMLGVETIRWQNESMGAKTLRLHDKQRLFLIINDILSGQIDLETITLCKNSTLY